MNFRPSLWKPLGGPARAVEVNRSIVGLVDVLFGNEEDFSVALGFPVEGVDERLTALDPASFKRMIGRVTDAFPNLTIVATTLRAATSATRNHWSAVRWSAGASALGVGQDLCDVAAIRRGEAPRVTAMAQSYRTAIDNARASL